MIKRFIVNILILIVLVTTIIGVSSSIGYAHPTLTDVKSFGATGNGTTDDSAAIQSAINEVNAAGGGNIIFTVGTYRIASDITFPDICTVEFFNGAKLSPDSTIVVTINSGVKAGLHQIFTGSGTVVGDIKEPYVYPQWWGAKGDGTTNCTAAFQYVVNNFQSVFVPKGIYLITDTITIPYRSAGGFYITGAGKEISELKFDPSVAGKVCIDVNSTPTSILYKGKISNIKINGQGTLQKIGVRVTNASELVMEDVLIYGITGNKSIGLQVRGRELCNYSRITIVADIPISIESNPDAWVVDLDSCHFVDIYTIAQDTVEPNIKIAPGLFITNNIFDGRQSWVGGKYGLYWNDSGGQYSSQQLSIRNVRYEQPAISGGYIIYINHSYAINELVLDNVEGGNGTTTNGFYLRNCRYAHLNNCMFNGTSEAMNIDGSNYYVTLSNTFFQYGSTVNLNGTMAELFTHSKYGMSTSLNAIYQTTSSAEKWIKLINTYYY